MFLDETLNNPKPGFEETSLHDAAMSQQLALMPFWNGDFSAEQQEGLPFLVFGGEDEGEDDEDMNDEENFDGMDDLDDDFDDDDDEFDDEDDDDVYDDEDEGYDYGEDVEYEDFDE